MVLAGNTGQAGRGNMVCAVAWSITALVVRLKKVSSD
jgi:hypothetical protein